MYRLLVFVLVVGRAVAAEPAGSAQAGKELFESQHCIACHSVNGEGGKSAPDLGKHIGRDFTPTEMVAIMWNHAPDMWSAMQKAGIQKPELPPQSAADLFAYFVAARFFDHPGDAGRGKHDFTSLHCSECHGITTSKAAGAPPVVQWESLRDPVALAEQMWNHASRMREEFAKRKIRWIELDGQQLTDILVYLQNLPETRSLGGSLKIGESSAGEQVFQSKGCVACHTGAMALEKRLRNQTLTDIAADMWDHEPLMKQPPIKLTEDEMRQILAYVWARQYFGAGGSAGRGKKVFTDKHCAACHNDASSGAPNLAQSKTQYSDIGMVSVLWQHGPRMLEAMRRKDITWPRFTTAQMADLIAYLNAAR